jgi:hypothetical protein
MFNIMLGNENERDDFEDLGVDGRIILKCKVDVKEACCKGVEWTNVTQNMKLWRDFVKAVMNLRSP